MHKDIIINGLSLNQYEIDRNNIMKCAGIILSENIEVAKGLIRNLVQLKDNEKIKELAQEAYNCLTLARRISSVCGIEYYLPCISQLGCIDSEIIFTCMLEDSNLLEQDRDLQYHIHNLYNLYMSMQQDSNEWTH